VNPRVAVIVVNHNGACFLPRCLTSVMAQSYPDFEIIVVDNASADSSVHLVRDRFPQVVAIEAGRNLGFAEGCNLGIRSTDAPLVATLNNDTWVEPDWLANLVRVMQGEARIGTCASKMLFANRPDIIDSAGVCVNLAGIAWDRLGGALDSEDAALPVDVFAACAGAALYRRQMLDDVGLFDPEFFIYLEDVDLSWRGQLRGWRTVYVPAARVYHVHSATSRECSPLKNFHLARNRIWMVAKNYPSPQFWLYLPLLLLYDLTTIPYSVLLRGDTSAVRGRIEALKGLPEIWQKRRVVQRRRHTSFASLRTGLSPLENPLRLLRRNTHLTSPSFSDAERHPVDGP
jgi:GT2 family glycosyltransferase